MNSEIDQVELATQLNSRQWITIPASIAETRFLIIGAGSVGSNVANLLCATNARDITIADFDVVGVENVYPQFYSYSDVGKPKVDALKDELVSRYAGVPTITAINARYTGYWRVDYDVVICCPDSNKDRRAIYDRGKVSWRMWLDGRFGEEDGQVFALPANATDFDDRHEHYLTYALKEGYEDNVDCGVRATSYLTKGLVPSIMVVRILQFLRGEEVPYITQIFGHTGTVHPGKAPASTSKE